MCCWIRCQKVPLQSQHLKLITWKSILINSDEKRVRKMLIMQTGVDHKRCEESRSGYLSVNVWPLQLSADGQYRLPPIKLQTTELPVTETCFIRNKTCLDKSHRRSADMADKTKPRKLKLSLLPLQRRHTDPCNIFIGNIKWCEEGTNQRTTDQRAFAH